MKETERIAKLFTDLYKGDSWIDVNITNTLKDISSANAKKKVHQEEIPFGKLPII